MSNKRILGKRSLTDGAPILLRKQGAQELNVENAASSSGYRACSDTHKDTPHEHVNFEPTRNRTMN